MTIYHDVLLAAHQIVFGTWPFGPWSDGTFFIIIFVINNQKMILPGCSLTRIAGPFFTTYEGVKSIFKKANPTLSGSPHPLTPQPFIDSAASAIAELVSCFILTPTEILKQNARMIRRLEHSSLKSSMVFQPSVTLEALKRFRKPAQLWRGYTALAARNLPFTAMQFPMFEHLKRTIKDYRQKKGTATGS